LKGQKPSYIYALCATEANQNLASIVAKFLEMTQRQKNYLYGGLLLGFCIVAGTIGIVRQKRLNENHILGQATVYDYSIGGRGNAGGVWLDFVFAANGKIFRSSSLYSTTQLDAHFINKQVLKKNYPIVYNQDNPGNAHLLLLAEDFKKYGFAYPDSLRQLFDNKKQTKD
jgi:hypothetical protein